MPGTGPARRHARACDHAPADDLARLAATAGRGSAGHGIAELAPVLAAEQHSDAVPVPAARPVAWTAVDAEAADLALAAALAGRPDATAGQAVNGNGHHNGSQNGHAGGHRADPSYPWDKP